MSRISTLHRSGFTLVELLVVISIMSLLISMLLPVLSGARKSAMQNACLNRHRSTITAALFYTNDYKSFLPSQTTYTDWTWAVHVNTYNATAPLPEAHGLGKLFALGYLPMGGFDNIFCSDFQFDGLSSGNRALGGWNAKNATTFSTGVNQVNQYCGFTLNYRSRVSTSVATKPLNDGRIDAAYFNGTAKETPHVLACQIAINNNSNDPTVAYVSAGGVDLRGGGWAHDLRGLNFSFYDGHGKWMPYEKLTAKLSPTPSTWVCSTSNDSGNKFWYTLTRNDF